MAVPVSLVRGVGTDSLGRVYVLDAPARLVLVFDSLGEGLGVIGNGYGAGPGEFETPSHMVVRRSGDVTVADLGSRRLTFFNAEGGLRGTAQFEFGVPLFVTALGDSIAVLRLSPRRSDSLVALLSADGEFLHWFRVGDEHQRDLADAGLAGVLTNTLQGAPLYIPPYPSRWAKLGDTVSWYGADRFPGLRTEYQRTPDSDVPLAFSRMYVSDAACFTVERCYMLVPRMAADADPLTDSGRLTLELVDKSGRLLATMPLEGRWSSVLRLFPSRKQGQVFLALAEPEPHVVLVSISLATDDE